MYRPLPDELTIKTSKIEGLGLFATVKIKIRNFPSFMLIIIKLRISNNSTLR